MLIRFISNMSTCVLQEKTPYVCTLMCNSRFDLMSTNQYGMYLTDIL
jgi:hypothetical protein